MTRIQSYRKGGLFLTVLMLLLFVLSIMSGSVAIGWSEIVQAMKGNHTLMSPILWHFRLPKAITCVLAGGALSVAGLMMQTLFRNPLAGPDVLGLSSGASLMVALLVFLGTVTSLLPFHNAWTLAIAASMGGGLVFLLIIVIAHYIRDNASILIIGLMISALTSSLVSVLQFIGQAEDLQTFMVWTLGNVGSTNWQEILVLSCVIFAGLSISYASIKSLNAWLLGDNYAQSLGVNMRRSRFWIVVSTGLLTGGVTAFCGPIAFVGLAVPHLVRLLVPTTNHKVLILAVMAGGASLLLLCDLIAQLPGSTRVLPLNAVTSMIGAPVVIWMIIRMKRIHV
jgi:iron complex transport system permease protein